MNTITRAAILVLAGLALTGCVTSGGSATQGENAFVHASTPADAAALKEAKPVTSDKLRLYVNGMGCPQCVSNIDLQLAKLKGVKATRVNLSNGTVDVDLYRTDHPSPAQIDRAVSGDFTLIRVEELK